MTNKPQSTQRRVTDTSSVPSVYSWLNYDFLKINVLRN